MSSKSNITLADIISNTKSADELRKKLEYYCWSDEDIRKVIEETYREKCYLCNDREAVGKFLGKGCCRECVSSISFS